VNLPAFAGFGVGGDQGRGHGIPRVAPLGELACALLKTGPEVVVSQYATYLSDVLGG
jgi:hypothetical protein